MQKCWQWFEHEWQRRIQRRSPSSRSLVRLKHSLALDLRTTMGTESNRTRQRMKRPARRLAADTREACRAVSLCPSSPLGATVPPAFGTMSRPMPSAPTCHLQCGLTSDVSCFVVFTRTLYHSNSSQKGPGVLYDIFRVSDWMASVSPRVDGSIRQRRDSRSCRAAGTDARGAGPG